MKNLILSTAIIIAVSTSANATGSINNNNIKSSPHTYVNPTISGGNVKSNSKANATGLGIAGAISGSKSGVNKSGNSDNNIRIYGDDNINKNRNNLNQTQDQNQSLRNNNDNASSAENYGNNTDVDIINQQRRIPVNPAYAAPLVASQGTCLGSVSGGVQGATFGISGAKTLLDEGCDLKRLVELTSNQFGVKVGNTLLCQNDERVREALIATTGYDCKPEIIQTVTYNTKSSCEYPTDFGCGKLGGRR